MLARQNGTVGAPDERQHLQEMVVIVENGEIRPFHASFRPFGLALLPDRLDWLPYIENRSIFVLWHPDLSRLAPRRLEITQARCRKNVSERSFTSTWMRSTRPSSNATIRSCAESR